MNAIKREDLANGIVIQLRKGKESKSFTLHTDKSVEEVRDLVFDYLNVIKD